MAIAPGPRVLSIKPPYAWAILIGRKKVENRSWNTPYRGTVFIHASRSLTRADVSRGCGTPFGFGCRTMFNAGRLSQRPR